MTEETGPLAPDEQRTLSLCESLDKPAATAARATAGLRGRIRKMRQELATIADGGLDGRRLHALVALQEEAVNRIVASPLTPLAASETEYEVADWLDDRRIRGARELAPALVAGGIDVDWLSQVDAAVGDDLEAAIHWIASSIDTELLLNEIDDAVTRISGLVGATKPHSR